MAAEFVGRGTGLLAFLVLHLIDAARDLPEIPAPELIERVLGWAAEYGLSTMD